MQIETSELVEIGEDIQGAELNNSLSDIAKKIVVCPCTTCLISWMT